MMQGYLIAVITLLTFSIPEGLFGMAGQLKLPGSGTGTESGAQLEAKDKAQMIRHMGDFKAAWEKVALIAGGSNQKLRGESNYTTFDAAKALEALLNATAPIVEFLTDGDRAELRRKVIMPKCGTATDRDTLAKVLGLPNGNALRTAQLKDESIEWIRVAKDKLNAIWEDNIKLYEDDQTNGELPKNTPAALTSDQDSTSKNWYLKTLGLQQAVEDAMDALGQEQLEVNTQDAQQRLNILTAWVEKFKNLQASDSALVEHVLNSQKNAFKTDLNIQLGKTGSKWKLGEFADVAPVHKLFDIAIDLQKNDSAKLKAFKAKVEGLSGGQQPPQQPIGGTGGGAPSGQGAPIATPPSTSTSNDEARRTEAEQADAEAAILADIKAKNQVWGEFVHLVGLYGLGQFNTDFIEQCDNYLQGADRTKGFAPVNFNDFQDAKSIFTMMKNDFNNNYSGGFQNPGQYGAFITKHAQYFQASLHREINSALLAAEVKGILQPYVAAMRTYAQQQLAKAQATGGTGIGGGGQPTGTGGGGEQQKQNALGALASLVNKNETTGQDFRNAIMAVIGQNLSEVWSDPTGARVTVHRKDRNAGTITLPARQISDLVLIHGYYSPDSTLQSGELRQLQTDLVNGFVTWANGQLATQEGAKLAEDQTKPVEATLEAAAKYSAAWFFQGLALDDVFGRLDDALKNLIKNLNVQVGVHNVCAQNHPQNCLHCAATTEAIDELQKKIKPQPQQQGTTEQQQRDDTPPSTPQVETPPTTPPANPQAETPQDISAEVQNEQKINVIKGILNTTAPAALQGEGALTKEELLALANFKAEVEGNRLVTYSEDLHTGYYKIEQAANLFSNFMLLEDDGDGSQFKGVFADPVGKQQVLSLLQISDKPVNFN